MRTAACLSFMLAACSTELKAEIVLSRSGTVMPLAGPALADVEGGVWAGWIEADGTVKIAEVDARTSAVVRSVALHRYAIADDHSAPSLLHATKGLLVATSAHSGDLFVYAQQGSAFSLTCKLSGRFTYPRLFRDDGRIRMLVRREILETEGPENYRGELAVVEIDGEGGCSEPETLMRPGFRQWIYAPYPFVSKDGVFIAWTIYDDVRRKHEGAYSGRLNGSSIVDEAILARPEADTERLVWSVDSSGVTVAAFSGQFVDGFFTCCRKGESVIETYSFAGELKARSGRLVTEYYPAPFSTRCNAGGIVIAAMESATAQIVVTTDAGYDQRDFRDARVTLCLK